MEIKIVSGNITRIRTGALIVAHYEGVKSPVAEAAAVDAALGGDITRLVKQGDITGKTGEITVIYSSGRILAGRVAVVGLGKQKSVTPKKIADATAEACRYLRDRGVTTVATGIPVPENDVITAEGSAAALTEGMLLGLYTFRRYKTKKDGPDKEIRQVKIIVGRKKAAVAAAVEKSRIIAGAVNWARDLVNEPSNTMTPTRVAEAAVQETSRLGLDIKVLDKKQIASLKMGGLLGVSQGSEQPPKFIVLTYKGKKTAAIDLALVGKGITFDSGGISIKPSENMADMKGDMAGAASVLATLVAVAQLKPALNVTALVPLTENLPSGTALKPGDVLTAMNGKTMEVLNTDAEGRLILADALSYAVKLGAARIIDVATLTGACQVALGNITTGAFSNNQALVNKVLAASSAVGEYAWELPMFPEYGEMIKGEVGDIKNTGGRYGGAITAAKFLSEFVGSKPWVHLDIAGTSDTDKTKGYQVKGATGVPVRALVNLIEGLAGKK